MLLSLLVISLLAACAAWPLARWLNWKSIGWVLAMAPAAVFAAFLRFAPAMARGEVIVDTFAWAPSLGLEFALRLDGFAFLFCLLISGVGALVVIYAGAYLAERRASDRGRFIALILSFMTAMLGAVLADNLLVLFLFWEATSVISFLLIGFDSDSPSARRSALMSLRVTGAGGLALLVSFLLIGAALDTYSLSEVLKRSSELANSPFFVAVIGGLLIGAFTKSAQFPFHFWLPNAMQAPTPASAYLHSATMVKLGIYLLVRFEVVVAGASWGRDVLMAAALATMLVGAFQAVRAENYKSVLAYSTVTSLGILVMLVALDGPMATVAMVGFLLAHALYKATLFFCAGTVIHATGISRLRLLGGLGRLLPVTATASMLASLSMAGLPPFIGFISKEFLFEAQIESSWNALPMAAVVLVNAVIVGVAGVVTLRPFFMNHERIREVRHREVPGLLLGPVTLALLGLVISVTPEWFNRSILGPAVASVYGQPVEIPTGMWHGFTPILLISLVVVSIGALLFIFWVPIHQRLRAQSRVDKYEAEHAYEASLRLIGRTSRFVHIAIQRLEMHGQLAVMLCAAGGFVAWGIFTASVPLRMPAQDTLDISTAIFGLVGIAGAIAAANSRSLIGAMIGTGLVGLTTAVIFMRNGAPDLALTQFAVESLLVVLLTAALLAMPLASPATRPVRQRARDAVLSVVLGAVVFIALLDMGASAQDGSIAAFFGARSYLEAFGRNVVNVILVDFRGFDTMIETTVVALSAVIAWSLLGPRFIGRDLSKEDAGRLTVFVLEFASPLFFWLLIVLSLAFLYRGHNHIGGGFVGGLMASLAFAIVAMARGISEARRRLAVSPLTIVGLGMLVAVSSGLPGLVVHGNFMHHLWFEAAIGSVVIKQGTTLLFDFGVYLSVLGTVLTFLFGLTRSSRA